MPNSFTTREEWLHFVMGELKPLFDDAGAPLPANVRLSVGFCSTGQRGARIGECWSHEASADKHFEIFIKPSEDDASRVADILAHELVHAAVGIDAGHGPVFKRVALAIGLAGKMTSTHAGDKFLQFIAPVLKKAGPLPHKRLDAGKTTRKKQSTRLIKCECMICGYTVRTTRKWLELGAPICPRDAISMNCDEIDDGED